jgi:hypothetical protein
LAADAPPLGLTSLRVQYLRPAVGFQLEASFTRMGEFGGAMVLEGVIRDTEGRLCAWSSGRVAPFADDASVEPSAPAAAEAPVIGEPWRQLLGLQIEHDDSPDRCVATPLPGRQIAPYDAIAIALTAVDGPGFLLAPERAAGGEFVSTAISMDLASPLRLAPSLIRGRVLKRGRSTVCFTTELFAAGSVTGIGLATYQRIR